MAFMSRRVIGFLASAAAMSTLFSPRAMAQSTSAKIRVVFQVSDADPAKWNLVLNNVRNAQTELQDDAPEIEVVAFGPGIGMLKLDSVVAQRIAEIVVSGVKVVACQNTMKNMKLSNVDMLPTVGFVPSGVVEIMRKQQQGYAYLRP